MGKRTREVFVMRRTAAIVFILVIFVATGCGKPPAETATGPKGAAAGGR